MNRSYFLMITGLMCNAALSAQTQPGATTFQPVQSLAGARGGGGGGRGPVAVTTSLRSETGKPFSATAVTQTTQTLSDGTHLSQTSTIVEYRDAEGRIRTETTQPGGSSSEQTKLISIRDPVAGANYTLDPAKRSAVKLPNAGALVPVAVRDARSGRGGTPQAAGSTPTPVATTEAQLSAYRGTLIQQLEAAVGQAPRGAQATVGSRNDIVEDLGTMTVNGVSARGTRTTTVVPVGAIGNDREFRSVSERWFSADLNLLVKSVSTDPRFGTTTYERTNISRMSPDPALFQVPADYSVVSR